jgi:tRNA threonylcarbamoyladenosine biosynthesis protein TsaE
MNYIINNIKDIDNIVPALAEYAKTHHIFCFFGELGAGKTTIIKQLCQFLGVQDEVSSPTYSIIQEYILDAKKVFHIDLYRLSSEEEALDIGLEDYLYSPHLCLIEWADNFLNIIPEKHINLKITDFGDYRRVEITENK